MLASVARSGKYLFVGLTFRPVNGPDDFNFVVDRTYAPDRGRRLWYTKEWIAYVDDLTVRTGRVVDGKFYTDSHQAVREACAKGSSVAAPQSAGGHQPPNQSSSWRVRFGGGSLGPRGGCSRRLG